MTLNKESKLFAWSSVNKQPRSLFETEIDEFFKLQDLDTLVSPQHRSHSSIASESKSLTDGA